MRNCLFCKMSTCTQSGIDCWVDDCAFFPPEEMDEEEEKNFAEYLEEQAQLELEEEIAMKEFYRKRSEDK